MLKAWLGVVDW